MKKFYITTPIYYVNDVPHIGHAYTTLAADILARFHRSRPGNEKVFFLTGTDEHGANIAQAAQKHGQSPQEYADDVAPHFRETWKDLNISHDYFIRTTDPRHGKAAGEVLQRIYNKGFVYEGIYEGWYCVGCEKFLTEKDLVNGKCPLHPTRDPVHQKEKNYFLKLSRLAGEVLKKIEDGKLSILPPQRRNEIVSRLKQGVEDVSISRAEITWGIPLPWDQTQTVYVWVEALLNYYTATRFLEGRQDFWPPDLQLMAKDILWFHAVIWPALLVAADLPLPKTIFAHGFFTLGGVKMSKSLGNVISSQQLTSRFGVDGTRYLLMTAYPLGSDGDISLERFTEKYNADLANGLGNLVSRVIGLGKGLDFGSITMRRENRITDEIESFFTNPEHPNYLRIDAALDYIWKAIKELDNYLYRERPWEKEEEGRKKILGRIILGTESVTSLLEIAAALGPFIPQTADEITGIIKGEKTLDRPLFPRLVKINQN